MCGLTGLLDADSANLGDARERILAMTSPLFHRGPDAGDVWVGDGIALGHRRLAIVDLSAAGAQPMASACDRWIIAFNGEIYNHLDLRRDLEAAGISSAWRGHSDTETLLACIPHWGLDETLRRAAGMFALALWDRRERQLSLARDRMGEKPLYWGWAGSTLIFGSELKALRSHPGFPREICRAALAQYLRFSYVPAPRSIHRGIYKLEPGTVLEIKGAAPSAGPTEPLRPGDRHGSLAIRRYWSLSGVIEEGCNTPFRDESEAITAVDRTVKAAVGRQMVADVSLGAFLSGGIDSSLIVALMQEQSSRPVKTFTIGFDNPAYNEAPHAAAVARHLGTNHSEMTVTDKDAQGIIPLLPDLYDEPFADSSQIPTFLLCRAARSHVSVALSGDAGDELFGGYNRYFWGPRIWQRLDQLPLFLRQMLGRGIQTMPIPFWDGLTGMLARIGGPDIVRPGEKAHRLGSRLQHVRNLNDLYRSLVSEWNGADLIRGLEVEPHSLLDDPLPNCLSNLPAAQMMAQDMRTYLPDDILCKVDRAAMGVSLETRVPFLDPSVIALSAKLPAEMKIRDNQGKWALRQILYHRVPRELIERPKAGFGIPVGEWLRGPLREWAEDLLAPERLSQDGLLDPVPIRKAWAEHQSRQHDWTTRLWIILMFQAWRDRWA